MTSQHEHYNLLTTFIQLCPGPRRIVNLVMLRPGSESAWNLKSPSRLRPLSSWAGKRCPGVVILEALALHIDDLAPLKFLITSRPISRFKTTDLIKNTSFFGNLCYFPTSRQDGTSLLFRDRTPFRWPLFMAFRFLGLYMKTCYRLWIKQNVYYSSSHQLQLHCNCVDRI